MAARVTRPGLEARTTAAGSLHGARGPNRTRLHLRKDTHMFSHQIAQVIHQDREREIEQRMRFRAAVNARSRSRRNGSSDSIRQSIGHRVIGIGRAIAADGPARRIGDPCGSIGELAARR